MEYVYIYQCAIACVVCKNGNHKSNTIAQYAMKNSELRMKDFIAFLYAQK